MGPAPRIIRPRLIDNAWRVTKSDLGTYIVSTLLGVLLSVGAGVLVLVYTAARGAVNAAPLDVVIVDFVLNVLAGTASMTVLAGVSWLAVRQLRGEPISIGMVFQQNGMIGQVALFSLIINIIMGVGSAISVATAQPTINLVVVVVTMVMLYSRYFLTPVIIIDQRKPVSEAAIMSDQALAGKRFQAWLAMFLCALVSGLGVLLCVVGILFTMPILYVAVGIVYHDFFRPVAPQPIVSEAPVAPATGS